MFAFSWPSSAKIDTALSLDPSKLVVAGFCYSQGGLDAHPMLLAQLEKSEQLRLWLELGEFKPSSYECRFLALDAQTKALVLNLGDPNKLSLHNIRVAFCSVGRFLLRRNYLQAQICLPKLGQLTVPRSAIVQASVEGLMLAQDPVQGVKVPRVFESLNWVNEVMDVSHPTVELANSALLTRRMINANADEMTPEKMAIIAQKLAEDLQAQKPHAKINCEVLDVKALERLGCGLTLAVGRAAKTPPCMVVLSYDPQIADKQSPVLLVGKGISYDTGGLKLKPAESMLAQRSDMSGAATALGIFRAYTFENATKPLVAILACAENAIGSGSFKHGDVYVSYAGKSVEITNTDAEGRLVLADALAYGIERFKPSHVIDMATLTGAAITALGHEAACLMSNNDELANQLLEASGETGERLWRMPLFEEYLEYLKSDVADLKNCGPAKASSSVAAVFLQQFIPSHLPWAHLDIAPVAFLDKERGLLSALATGFGLRLVIQWLRNIS